MSDRSKKQKKCFVTDNEISDLLNRYSPTTVLALLQEVAQVDEVNIDWDALVEKTKTGITNAREYQMLWRHLAYRHPLIDGLDDEAEPLDDDSDLEYELEPYPAISNEASVEAAACVKVLMASGTQNGSHMSNGTTVEAPLTISIPAAHRSRNSPGTSQHNIPMEGSNIIVPVSVPRIPLPNCPNVIPTKVLDTNGPSDANLPPRRKRKLWSEAEDMELIAAVKKHGEGNWANIARADFDGVRTASQLSKRWTVIKKQQSSGVKKPELSEIHLAHRALSLALDVPMRDSNSKATCSTRNEKATSSNLGNPSSADTKSQHQGQKDFASNAAPKLETQGTSKPLESARSSTIPTIRTNSMVKAAAVAAGARIASPSDAASLLKAAKSKNAVHIISGQGPVIKSSLSGNTNAFPSNVQRQYVNPASTDVQSNVVGMTSGLKTSTKIVPAGTNSNPAAELGTKTVEIVSEKIVAQENHSRRPNIALEGDRNSVSTRNVLLKQAQGDQIAVPVNSAREKIGVTTCSDDQLLQESRQGNSKAPLEKIKC